MSQPIVIIGAGQAAASLISRYVSTVDEADRQPITLIGEEPHPPYQRPPLSKNYLKGELEYDRLLIRPQQWYDDNQIETRLGLRVQSIDRESKQVITDDGETIEYNKLVLATGSRARTLPDSLGGALEGVYTLRSISDINFMVEEFQPGRRLLIVGGGYIGLEAAAVGRTLGVEVTLLEMADRILQRVAAEQTSNYFRQLHKENGVDIREATRMSRLTEAASRINGAELESGETIAADFALIGIGGQPNTELAEAAGLECENGIAVDSTCQTSDPDIYAAGDCTSFVYHGQRIRLESVQNASDQGDLIGRILAGQETQYQPVPWFWSDQYDSKLQIAGLNQGFNKTVTRPGTRENGHSIWYYADDDLLAVDAINDPTSYVCGRKMLELGKNPAPEIVSDPETNLKALIKG